MTTPSNTEAPVPFGWCHWHKGPSGTAVLVQIIEQNSGPGVGLYACAPCREQRGLVTYSEQTHEAAYRDYLLHTTDCEGCSRIGRCEVGRRLRDIYQKALDGAA
ncbi:hypothetical protein DKT74_14250 [Streptomyces sp. ZEA17I]|uniref:hypothetical protein n=1 Tax=Streptomyces sp. ZEA17I TaxID=2202516 RepID=UPI000D6FEA8D|nr:hypothetical protein [Streptomyces sp. ZEA17I]PWS43897.1 hypothetical protein DKT74_14250 [Streptomyces sp. ZEA17I]